MDPRALVVAIAASTRERAEHVARRIDIPAAHDDWRSLVEDKTLDAVTIAVPPAAQPEIAAAAAAAGKAVFCEKPLAQDLAGAEVVARAVLAAGVAAAVDLELGELDAWGEAERALSSGALGRVDAASFWWSVRTRARTVGSWKTTNPMGGALGGFASHALHLIERCLGPIARLSARLDDAGGSTTVDARLALASGASVDMRIATNAADPAGLAFDVRCAEGTVVVSAPADGSVEPTLRVTAGGTTRTVGGKPSGNEDPRIRPVAAVASRFIDAALGGRPVHPGLTEGLRVQLLLELIATAHASGVAVDMPTGAARA